MSTCRSTGATGTGSRTSPTPWPPMRDDGVRRALAFVTSPYGSYSSCRQYLEDIAAARATVGAGCAGRSTSCGTSTTIPGSWRRTPTRCVPPWPPCHPTDRERTRLVFTAHSVPLSMAKSAGPTGGRYTAQLTETRRTGDGGGRSAACRTTWSGRAARARRRCRGWSRTSTTTWPGCTPRGSRASWSVRSGSSPTTSRCSGTWTTRPRTRPGDSVWTMRRAATPGIDPRFVAMVRELVVERLDPTARRRKLGRMPVWDACPDGCCAPPRRPVPG